MSAWKSRGGLPVAVEITAGLITIHLQDPCITYAEFPSLPFMQSLLNKHQEIRSNFDHNSRTQCRDLTGCSSIQ